MNNIFTDSRINLNLQAGIKKINFFMPTKVQEKVIPALLAKKNLVVQAVTGSGKSHAFLIPVLNEISAADKYVQAIITAPSRELAQQLYQVARQLRDASELDISIMQLAGGSDRNRQLKKIGNNKPQIIIATPGRLRDFVQNKIFNIDYVKYFIVDEADMTMDLGNLPDIDFITQRLGKKTVIAAFSATIPDKLANFLRKYLPNLEKIVIDNSAVISPTVKNDLLDIGSKNRQEILYQLLTMGQPYLAVIFANTKQKVDELTQFLQMRGLKVTKIHGGITERERKRALREVEQGQFRYVVATDLAARGLDIAGVSLVINYEIPKDLTFIVHRIGRTGRNGLPGHAITLIKEEQMNQIAALEHLGINFDFVQIKSQELVPRKHYHRRDRHNTAKHEIDPKLNGYLKKEKQKRKPGYKRKIQQAIRKDKRQKRKLELRHEVRKAKRQRKRKRDDSR